MTWYKRFELTKLAFKGGGTWKLYPKTHISLEGVLTAGGNPRE